MWVLHTSLEIVLLPAITEFPQDEAFPPINLGGGAGEGENLALDLNTGPWQVAGHVVREGENGGGYMTETARWGWGVDEGEVWCAALGRARGDCAACPCMPLTAYLQLGP